MTMPTLPRIDSLSSLCLQDGPGPGQNPPHQLVRLQKPCRLCRKKRRGAAAVEFAVVAPLFFLMIFGMIEFGRMIMVQQLLTNASREGARLGVLDGSTMADVRTSVKNYLENVTVTGVTDDDIDIEAVQIDADTGAETVVMDLASAGYGGRVTVTITIPFNQVSWLSSPMIMDVIDENMELSASTVMRRETVQ